MNASNPFPKSRRKTSQSADAQKKRRLKAVIDLADTMDDATFLQTIDAARRIQASRKPAGRPTTFDAHHLIDVWLFVKEGTDALNLSIKEFCKRGTFNWYTTQAQAPFISTIHSIKGETLRRRYQDAVRMLKNEAAIYAPEKALPGSKAPSGRSPLEEWCYAELERRRAG